MSFEYGSNSFYLLNTENEVQELVLSSSNKIFTKEKVRSRSLEKYETPAISNMKNYGLDIYLSIRGFGVAYLNKQKDELVFRTEDAQDLVFLKNHEVLVIADYKGLIFYRLNEKKPFKSLELPNGDFPQEIKSFNNKILAKGKLGLYLIDTIDFKITEVWNEKVGAFNSYYDMIFISSKNTLHMISNSENTIEYFKRNNNLEIDVKKYFR